MLDRDFRLSRNVLPSRYDIHVAVDLDAWRFHGSERIDVSIGEATDSIVVHAVDLTIARAEAVLEGGRRVAARVSIHEQAEAASLQFAERLGAGPAQLEIEFSGEIRARLRGFYRSQKDGLRYAATQFEAADARRAFPCFDEPEFKARFALALTVPEDLVAIANGRILAEEKAGNGRKHVRFAETPPISSYLVAYTVGPYEATPEVTTPTGHPVRVFLPRGMADKGLFARDAHARSLTYLEDYTAIPYPYTKVDAIGVPDFEAGAMENPGAITYRLTAIAADEARSSTNALKGIFYTAAHELTHMWWGDLVTMAWWDDLWLNESFATFIGYKVVADLVPEWGMWRDFVATLTRPFNLDALESTHPISFEVKNAKQATERFDVITYWKGAGVVRMIEGFLGADRFRAGVRSYLERYRERNATADDFWRELSQASGRDVGRIANAWIKKSGHPLVSITAREEDGALVLQLRQQRFFADRGVRDDAAETWPIPLVIRYGTAAGAAEQQVLLDAAEASVRLPAAQWFYPNKDGAGFFRFALDDGAMAALVRVIQQALNPQERLALVGNQWALVKAGKVPVAQFFSMLRGFRDEPDRAVLAAITERLGWLETHVLEDASRPAFEKLVADFYAPAYADLGWEPRAGESTDDRQRRATVLSALGHLGGAAEIIDAAEGKLAAYFSDRTTLDPNLVSVVVELCARRGGVRRYEQYLERKKSALKDPEEEQRFLFGLAGFDDPQLIARTLALTLTDEVRPQDRAHFFARLLGSRHSRLAAWQFVRKRWDDIVAQMDPMLQQNMVRGLALVTPQPAAGEVLAFLPEHATDETRETVQQAIEQLRIDAAACSRMAGELQAALAEWR